MNSKKWRKKGAKREGSMAAMTVDSIGIEDLTVTVAKVEQQMASRSVWKSMTELFHKEAVLDQKITDVESALEQIKYNAIEEENFIRTFLESLVKLRTAIVGVLDRPKFPHRQRLQGLLPEIDDVIENLRDSIDENIIRTIHEVDS